MAMKRWWMLLVAPAVLLPALAVIALSVMTGGGGEKRAGSATPTEFPQFVYYSPKSEQGYRLAVEHQSLFARMPCYCGCGAMPEDPHRNLLDCFINEDGSFDSHASGCDICVDIAVDAVQWRAEGKSFAEVRSLVDAKYRGYGPSTSAGPVID
jgi:hypothetical protein